MLKIKNENGELELSLVGDSRRIIAELGSAIPHIFEKLAFPSDEDRVRHFTAFIITVTDLFFDKRLKENSPDESLKSKTKHKWTDFFKR